MAKQITTLDTYSGKVAQVPAIYLDIPEFASHLVEVPEGTKSYEASKYKPQTADEYRESHKKAAPAKEAAPEKSSDA